MRLLYGVTFECTTKAFLYTINTYFLHCNVMHTNKHTYKPHHSPYAIRGSHHQWDFETVVQHIPLPCRDINIYPTRTENYIHKHLSRHIPLRDLSFVFAAKTSYTWVCCSLTLSDLFNAMNGPRRNELRMRFKDFRYFCAKVYWAELHGRRKCRVFGGIADSF